MKHRGPYARRGSGYLLILGSAMLVSVIGLTALMAARIESKSQQAACNAARARAYARSAIEVALAFSYADSAWRSNYGTLSALMPMTLDTGTCSSAITQPDGTPLVVDSDEAVLLTSTGTMGTFAQPSAIYKWSVAAHQPALDLLGSAALANGAINVSGSVIIEDGPLSTNQTLTNSGTINGDIEARVLNNTGTITGIRTISGPAKYMPSVAVLNYYRSRATVLSASTVGNTMQWELLSPQLNPYGMSNTNGLYYIRPSGDFTIRNDRIVGTMIVELNSGKKLTIEQGMLWEVARPDYPALIVVGNCVIQTATTLSESNNLTFNPSITPYQGQSDNDRNDSYPSSIKGVIHIMGSGSVTTINASTHTIGTVIAEGSLSLNAGTTLTADSNLLANPPQMYRSSWLILDQGTWNRVLP